MNERKWVGLGTGALGALAFDDEATALQYAQDCGVGEVVEYVPASDLREAVDALREISRACEAWLNDEHFEGKGDTDFGSDAEFLEYIAIIAGGQ
jgi:hypothetical protein